MKPFTREEFAKLYEDRSLKLTDIAAKLGIARQAVTKWRSRFGIQTRTIIPENRPQQRAEFERLYRETPMGARAIARKLGVTIEIAKNWRRALGLPQKPKANAQISRRLN